MFDDVCCSTSLDAQATTSILLRYNYVILLLLGLHVFSAPHNKISRGRRNI